MKEYIVVLKLTTHKEIDQALYMIVDALLGIHSDGDKVKIENIGVSHNEVKYED